MMGTPPYQDFQSAHPGIPLHTFAEAAQGADLVINGIDGAHAVQTLAALPSTALAGKTLIDYAVPYRYQQPDEADRPWPTPWSVMPRLEAADTDSLAEQIQRALPASKVVKAFVTQEQETVTHPEQFADGDHTTLLAGDHTDAKDTAAELLRSYGWHDIIDLGPLPAARGMEMYAHLHTAIGLALRGRFGVKIIR
ncbi:NADPH-dependent F420 reductase [Streptomyces sp. NPDC017529]|uniref:NADPH-dependent F420 reductase n=1 Tax=Streptomyces sp. NPDC017529 TaxID=3365000 RepID=UPI0037A00D86